ncbi:ATP-binding protein [Nocardioides sp.]|uniref:sensor histidine kinase n=1 Tax=Nocardioides sp. TaxID=35761 RepID=UPI003528494F
MRSLTGRLVATAVALVALVSLMVVGLTTYAMSSYLSARLDERVLLTRPGPPPAGDFHGADHDHDDDRAGAPGTLTAALPATGTTGGYGTINDADQDHSTSDLTTADLAALDDVPSDQAVHVVDLPDAGEYHVVVRPAQATTGADARIVIGLPSSDVTRVLSSLLTRGLALAAAGVLLAGAAGFALVRRQLRPLREVAATAHEVADLPLATGDINLTTRVPAHLTDERTEVGQVGSALNMMLAHVESSLEARHRSEQQVRQFVADASHELRTPLSTITGYTELARKRPEDTGIRETALSKIEAESDRMTSLVEDLLLLARLDAGRPLEREQVDVSRILVEAVSDARVLAGDHQWRLELPDQALEIQGDELRLHQVATNLLTNARRYTPAGTTVTVRARRGEISVHDDGPGFPPDLVASAFERFARGDVSRTRAGEGGVGLGLSLVKAIAVAHGGSVRLESTPGDTTITVALPGLIEATAG